MRSLLARLALAAALFALVLLGVLLAVLPSSGKPLVSSVFTFEPGGMRALYLTVEGLGFPVQAWNAAPSELPAEDSLLVLAALPASPPAVPETLARIGDGTSPRRGRDLSHYRAFVEHGGALLVLGADAAELDFVQDELGLEPLAEVPMEWGSFSTRALDPEHLDFAPGGASRLVATEDGRTLVTVYPSGAGRVVLCAVPPSSFRNYELEDGPESTLFFVRLLEALRPFRRVLFDEYALGGWRPAPVLALAFSPRLAWLTLQVLLLLAFLGWRSAWSGPFARDPETWRALSPLARAQAAGGLLARAGRFDLLATQLRRGVLERWEARAGRRASAGAEEALEGAPLLARLKRIARGDAAREKRLRELFVTRSPADERALDALDRELAAFEAELLGEPDSWATPARSAHGPGSRPASTRS